MKKPSIGSLLFALFINAVLLILAYNSTIGYHLKEVRKNRIADINFDSRSNDPKLNSIKSYSEQSNADIKDISIHFTMKIRSAASAGDVFQTAPLDRGMRLELQNGELNWIINTKSNNPQSFTLIKAVQPNVDYPITLSIDRNNKLTLMIGSESGEGIDDILHYEISDIAIGTGFGKLKPFDGVISDFSMEYSLYDPVKPGFYSVIQSVLIFSMIILLGLLFYASYRTPEFLTRETKITLASAIILIGFFSAVFFHYFMGAYMNKPYPWNTFLFIPSDGFNDFFSMLRINHHLNPYFFNSDIHSNYYPFANIIFYIFSLSHKTYEWVSFSFFLLIFTIPFALLNRHYLSNGSKSNLINMLIFTFLTLPFLITIDRGNIESWVFLCTALFIYYFQKNKSIPACIFLSMAIAMKLFPAIFLILFVTEKKYKEIGFTLLFTSFISVVSLSLFQNGFFNNLHFVLSGFGVSNWELFGNNNYLRRGVSLFTIVKIWLINTNHIHSINMPSVISIYVKISLIIFGLIALYIYFIEKEFWKRVTLIVCPMLFLPHMSADYRLLYIFIPLYLYVNNETKTKLDLFYLLALVLLLIPKDYWYLQGFLTDSGKADYSINNTINTSILVIMTVVIMASGLNVRIRKNVKPALPVGGEREKI